MSEYYAVIRSTDHLAHYGVKGMKWGVRKAIARGNERALDRHFRKAAKKLKKLQDIGLHSGKYAAKAAGYGAAAVGTGTLAVGGTGMLARGLNKIGKANPGLSEKIAKRYAKSVAEKVNPENLTSITERYYTLKSGNFGKDIEEWGKKPGIQKLQENPIKGTYEKKTVLTNNDLYRIGAGVVTAGLAAKSAQNAYRASHGAKYREKAREFRNAMDNEFAGTKYAGQYIAPPKQRKRRKVK